MRTLVLRPAPVSCEARDIKQVTLTPHSKHNQRSCHARPRLSNPINHGRPPPIAAQSSPRPTNTITDASATVGAVGGSDSAAMAVTMTANAGHKCQALVTNRQFASRRKDRGQRGPQKQAANTQQSIVTRTGVAGWRRMGISQQSAVGEGKIM